MPYNYLLDPAVRETLSLSLRGAVVIVDEAHNVESVCCEVSLSSSPSPLCFLIWIFFCLWQAMSFELTSTELALCLGECDKLVKITRCGFDFIEELTLDEVLVVKEKLLKLEEVLSGLVGKLPPSNDPNFLGLSLSCPLHSCFC